MTPQRILVTGGLLLIFLGICYGLIHAGFIVNPLREARVERMQLALDYTNRNEMERAFGYLKEASDIQLLWERNMDAHTHITIFGFQSLLFASILPNINLAQRLLLILSWLLVLGRLLLPTGVVLEALGFEKPGFLMALLGGGWIFLATFGFLAGAVRGLFRAK